MNDKEQSRLEKLQQVGYFSSEKLDRSDLLLLLRHDGEVRQAILQMVDQSAGAVIEPDELDCVEEESFCPAEAQVSAVEPPRLAHHLPAVPALSPARDSWRNELSPELELLAWVQADEALSAAWLGQPDETAARQLVRLIAVASQWEQVLLLWDRFAARCKQEQRPASVTERQILKRCLALHNLIWQGRQARLQQALPGEEYEPRQHDRGTVRGDIVSAEWLPGLLNAAGQLQKKPLVRT